MDTLINILNQNGVRYLVIGGQAVRLEGLPRFTMDWDLFIPAADAANLNKLNALLAEWLDAPVVPLGARGENFVQTYQTPWGILQFHLAPVGLPHFAEAELRGVTHATENGTSVRCVCGADLLACKRAVGRDRDREDIEFLEEKRRAGTLSGCGAHETSSS